MSAAQPLSQAVRFGRVRRNRRGHLAASGRPFAFNSGRAAIAIRCGTDTWRGDRLAAQSETAGRAAVVMAAFSLGTTTPATANRDLGYSLVPFGLPRPSSLQRA